MTLRLLLLHSCFICARLPLSSLSDGTRIISTWTRRPSTAEVPPINPFDAKILHFLNQFAHRSWLFDHFICFVDGNVLLKGGIITAFLWWAWFRRGDTKPRDREFVLSGIVMAIAALAVARTLALFLPFRERPLFTPQLNFRPPFGTDLIDLIHWSSFPSDHAALYFCLATTVFCVSRKIGLLAFAHALFVGCFSRIYLGAHYPTDILAGAAIGIGIGSLSLLPGLRHLISRWPLRWLEAAPGSFYFCFYLTTLLIGTNFDSIRSAILLGFHALKSHILT